LAKAGSRVRPACRNVVGVCPTILAKKREKQAASENASVNASA
jgi:hypothetical protein